MKDIVILGGGFAGIAACREIEKHLPKFDINLTLIDRQSSHLFTPSLYEVASSEQPKGNIVVPFSKILSNKVKILKDQVSKIDPQKQEISLSSGDSVHFDYLVIALGSETAYFGIEGLKEYSLPLKTVNEAYSIKQKIKEKFDQQEAREKSFKVFIGGGGFSGTELAAELTNYREYLTKANKTKIKAFEISIIEGTDRLLNGLETRVSELAKKRLEKSSVKLYLSSFIEKVSKNQIFLKGGQVLDYDVLIWTGGITPNSLLKTTGFPLDKRGGVLVTETLQVEGYQNIFVAGDSSFFLDKDTGRGAPAVAQIAEDEGRLVGKNVINLLSGREVEKYELSHHGYVVPLRGKYSAAELKILHFHGFFAWVLQQLIFLRYLLGILPLVEACKRWNKVEMELMK